MRMHASAAALVAALTAACLAAAPALATPVGTRAAAARSDAPAATAGPATARFVGAPSELTVNPGESIQAAVDAVSAGGTVHLAAGLHVLAAPITIGKAITLEGPNAGISPNAPGDPLSANPQRAPEATIAVTGGTSALTLSAPGIAVRGLRFTNAAAAAADVNAPLIASGGGIADTAITENLFDGISRTAVFLNGPTTMHRATVDDNRVAAPGRPASGCAGSVAPSGCGHALFNLWRTTDLSFAGNVVIGAPGNGDRVRVLNVESSAGVTITGNTIRHSCTYTCVTIAGSTTGVEVTANDAVVDVGNVVLLHSTWATGTVAVTGNRFSDAGDFAIAVDNPAADLDGVVVSRNALIGGALRNAASQPVAGACNWFGAASGPIPDQLQGPMRTTPFLATTLLSGACPAPPPTPDPVPPYVAPTQPDVPATTPAPAAPEPATAPLIAGETASAVAPPAAPTPAQVVQARADAGDALGAPAKRDPAFDLGGGALVFVPTSSADRPADAPRISGSTVKLDRDAIDANATQNLLAVSCPTAACTASFTLAVTYTDARGRQRTVKLAVPDQQLGSGDTAVLNLKLPKAVRKLLLAGAPVRLSVGIGVSQADGAPIGSDTRRFTLKTNPAPRPNAKRARPRGPRG